MQLLFSIFLAVSVILNFYFLYLSYKNRPPKDLIACRQWHVERRQELKEAHEEVVKKLEAATTPVVIQTQPIDFVTKD